MIPLVLLLLGCYPLVLPMTSLSCYPLVVTPLLLVTSGAASAFSQDVTVFAELLKPQLLAVGVPSAEPWRQPVSIRLIG